MISKKDHWELVYATKRFDQVSWFTTAPVVSLRLIDQASDGRVCSLIDVGGGASVLVDRLLDRGFKDLAVLDIASPRWIPPSIGLGRDPQVFAGSPPMSLRTRNLESLTSGTTAPSFTS